MRCRLRGGCLQSMTRSRCRCHFHPIHPTRSGRCLKVRRPVQDCAVQPTVVQVIGIIIYLCDDACGHVRRGGWAPSPGSTDSACLPLLEGSSGEQHVDGKP
jgi:hypothetical protein